MWKVIRDGIFHFIDTKIHHAMSALELSEKLCPHAIGINVGGVRIPPANILVGNAIATTYTTRMLYVTHLGVDYWVRIATKAYSQGVMLEEILLAYAPQSLNKVLPLVLYSPDPEAYEIRMCTIHELIQLKRISTTREFLEYLITFIAFGIYIDQVTATEVLKLSNPQQFVAARLFQGELDGLISDNNVTAFTPFQSYTLNDSEVYDPSEFMDRVASSEWDPDTLAAEIREQENIAANATFVDNSTDMWKVLQEAKMSQLPPHYQKYLAHEPDHTLRKLGLKHFNKIVNGEADSHIRRTHQPDANVVQEPISKKNSAKTPSFRPAAHLNHDFLKSTLPRVPFS